MERFRRSERLVAVARCRALVRVHDVAVRANALLGLQTPEDAVRRMMGLLQPAFGVHEQALPAEMIAPVRDLHQLRNAHDATSLPAAESRARFTATFARRTL